MSTLERAIAIAKEAHAGQKDKAGQPYIGHPMRVMESVGTDDERIVAVLHDVVEDSDWTLDMLLQEGFSPPIVEAVDALTKRPAEDYEKEFIPRTGRNPLARRVKLADLADNLDRTRLLEESPKNLQRAEKYRRARAYLVALG
ncbi:MAG: HD domain-containing protein [Syntrophomonadaceae bacterium]